MNEEAGDEFIERMGLAIQADGLPRIAGRLFGFFIVHGGTHSFSELAERLQVSRGSISTNARLLESLGILARTARAGDRQDYFRLSDDPYGRLLRGYIERMEQNQKLVSEALAKLDGPGPMADRLRQMHRFYETALQSTREGLSTWRRDNARS